MTEYERLRKNLDILECHKIIKTHVKTLTNNEKTKLVLIQEIIDDCRALLNKIENGTLIELPCKIDGIVYFVSKKKGVQWSGITEIQVLLDRYTKVIQVRDDDYKWHTVNNNTVFLTKAEAEAKLNELQEKDNDSK